ncbi:MAG TPA: NAD-dependent epimerase/dehydratase family protein, partial [Thermoplasmata archaeon]|nr:NAD-dependent epimerase/dehydratase family protein [Thermoplasmata archaeon]
MKVLITGITGFIGSHLAQELLEKTNYELIGTFRDA